MPEPADHRADAEKWLEMAKRWPDDKQLLAVVDALIGIGHALLAPSEANPATTINLTGYATREQIRDVLQRHTTTD